MGFGPTCTERGKTWWGSAGSRRLSWFWSHSLWGDTAETERHVTNSQFRLELTFTSCWISQSSPGGDSPRTSAAGTVAAPSPSPRRSRHRWTRCESSRAAWRVPASPSRSSLCRGQRSSPGFSLQSSLDRMWVRSLLSRGNTAAE